MVGRNIHEALTRANTYQVLRPDRTELDLEDRRAVELYITETCPDAIVHAAGLVGGIRANIARPVEFLAVNLRIGTNVIDGAKDAGVPILLNIASSCMYPREEKNPLGEESILSGMLEPTNEGYAIAKIAATRHCQYILQQHNDLNYKTIVPCNLYGKYDHFDPENGHMIASVIQRMHKAKEDNDPKMMIWGDGTARREFMFAGDLAGFVARYLEKADELPDVMNVGLGQDFTIREYYEAISHVIGYVGEFQNDLTKPVGMKQKLVSVARQNCLGWAPGTTLEEGLRIVYDYYLATVDC